MPDKSQEESEAFVKAYQLEPVISTLARIEIKMEKQITEDALKLALQPINSEIKILKDKEKTRSRVIWTLIPIVAALLISTAWQYIINNGRLQ